MQYAYVMNTPMLIQSHEITFVPVGAEGHTNIQKIKNVRCK